MVDTFEQASSWNPREWNVTPNSDLELCQCELRWLSNEWCEYRRELRKAGGDDVFGGVSVAGEEVRRTQ